MISLTGFDGNAKKSAAKTLILFALFTLFLDITASLSTGPGIPPFSAFPISTLQIIVTEA
ncbi:MAG: hypothetical protein CSA50_04880 [Gammaproteobacteria bacterium]|nr:MAG: hypothetical protein CSA50_04880 [Gammaproteobacteria bacterium]